LPRILRTALFDFANRLMPIGLRGRNLLKTLGTDLKSSLPLPSKFFDFNARRRLLPFLDINVDNATERLQEIVPRQADIVERATRMDFHTYLAEDILVKVDRASMLNSLEVRAPFLDTRIIEFAFRKVPPRLKVTPSRTKILLKMLARRILPANLELDRKQGFSIPLASWLSTGPFRSLFWDTLLDSSCLFDRKYVQHLLIGQDRGRSNSERLFALVLFELWRKAYRVHL
jgi:asparagine synthase (glutamine-hydrolysing)